MERAQETIMETLNQCLTPEALSLFIYVTEMTTSQGSAMGELNLTNPMGNVFVWVFDSAKEMFCFAGEQV